MTNPSAASLLINALEPKQRAIMHEALLMYKEKYEAVVLAEPNPHTNMRSPVKNFLKRAIKWKIDETNKITQTLFAECFLTDMDSDQYCAKELYGAQESSPGMDEVTA